MERLTSIRASEATGAGRYWSSAKKDDLVQKLGQYEDSGLEPGEINGKGMSKEDKDFLANLLIEELRNARTEHDYTTRERCNDLLRKLGR